MRTLRFCLWGLLILSGLLLSCPSARAQSQIAGTYRCSNIQVGKRRIRCSSPPLTLFPDGRYQIWGERGTYTVLGSTWCSPNRRSAGRGVCGAATRSFLSITTSGGSTR
jgi:hypothetical protein